MANEEHLKILLQGVEVWNQWREYNPGIKPDISTATFKATFSKANTSKATFRTANLIDAYFKTANLIEVYLSKANLQDANLREAYLNEHNLSEANLRGANLYGTYFDKANLSGADLSKADLRVAHLRWANLRGANFSGASLIRAVLTEADLSGADLNEADLTTANLAAARLLNANLNGANLTGVHLWETQRAGWSIKGIICEYVYWDEHKKEKTEYASGEFEKLFAAQTKIKLLYKDGISPLEIATLPALIQHLEAKQGCALRFVNIHDDAGGAVVELALEDTVEKTSEEIEAIKRTIEAEAERNIQILRDILETKEGKIKKLKGKVEGLEEIIIEIWKGQKGETIMGDKYEISGQAGAVGKNARADHNNFNQLWNQSKDSIDLTKLADELAQLRTALKQEAVEVEHDVAVSEVGQALIEAKAGNGSKVMEHLKSAGKWAFDTATKIGTSVAADVIKKSMEP